MTEAMKKWATEKSSGVFLDDEEAADFWVRAFCDELEKRVEKKAADTFACEDYYNDAETVREAFQELKRELLG